MSQKLLKKAYASLKRVLHIMPAPKYGKISLMALNRTYGH